MTNTEENYQGPFTEACEGCRGYAAWNAMPEKVSERRLREFQRLMKQCNYSPDCQQRHQTQTESQLIGEVA